MEEPGDTTVHSEGSDDLSQPQLCKTDIAFYQAFKKSTRKTLLLIAINAIAFPCFLIMYVQDREPSSNLQISLVLNVIASGLQTTYWGVIVNYVYCSSKFYYEAATDTAHISKNEPMSCVPGSSSLESLTSAIIFVGSQDLRDDSVSADRKKVYVKVTERQIRATIQNKSVWVKRFQIKRNIAAFLSLVYTIVVLTSEDLSSEKRIIFLLYALVMVVVCFPIICCLFCMVSVPLCCLGCIAYCCFMWCFSRDSSSAKVIDMSATAATTEEIVNAGGDCSICYMAISEGSQIYVLPCSEKHVFHSGCLGHWTKIKSTCPMCRAAIPMRNKSNGN